MSYPFKILLFLLLFVLLLLLQQSFLYHFKYLAKINLCLAFIFLLNVLSEGYLGILAGFLGGFILDVFSPLPFGIFTFNLTIISFLTKKFSRVFQKISILGFSCLFAIYFFAYKVLLMLEGLIFGFSFSVMAWLGDFLLTFLLVLFVLAIKKIYDFSQKEKTSLFK